MKITDKKKPVDTIPKGVWEATRPPKDNSRGTFSPESDLQENGYPDRQTYCDRQRHI